MRNKEQIREQTIKDYEAAKAEAYKQLAAVKAMIDNHAIISDVTGDVLDYGHVGDMNHVAAKLRELATDSNH